MTWGVVNMYEVALQCWERGEVESMIKFQHEIGAQNQIFDLRFLSTKRALN